MSFYRYIASELVLGSNSPHTKSLNHFNLGPFSARYNGIKVEEDQVIGYGNLPQKLRTLRFNDGVELVTSHISVFNDISKIITYRNNDKKIYISDVLFKEEDFKFNENYFNKLIKAVIYKTSILIQAFNEKIIEDVPLIINDFENIVEILYLTPDIF